MALAAHSPDVIRFGVFEVCLSTGELRRSGLKIKLQDQAFRVLAALLEHPGQLVTREELQKKLWSTSTSPACSSAWACGGARSSMRRVSESR